MLLNDGLGRAGGGDVVSEGEEGEVEGGRGRWSCCVEGERKGWLRIGGRMGVESGWGWGGSVGIMG